MATLGTGRGKLLLFGEHAAVYGYPAVGVSLEAAVAVELERDGRGDWELVGVEEQDRDAVERTLRFVEQLAGGGPRGGRAWVRSSVPRGLGFGSSAALCTALASAFAPAGSEPRQIWQWAHEAERLFHGTPSGIDTGLSLLRGLYSFRPRPPALPESRLLRGLPMSLVVGAVPRLTNAGALIAALRQRVGAGHGPTKAGLERLGQTAAQAAAVLDREAPGGVTRLGELALEAGEVLAQLGLASADLEAVLAEGRREGALGGKLSGAGGGGAFFLVYPDAASAQDAAYGLRRSVEARGLPTAGTIETLTLRPQQPGSPEDPGDGLGQPPPGLPRPPGARRDAGGSTAPRSWSG
jgi:mevalonate kinase